MNKSAPLCQNCGKISTSKCTNCRKAFYCSREHQKKDWKRHKENCFPAKVATSEQMGRYFTAARDIAERELILKEDALFSAPNAKLGPQFILCLVCYGIVTSENSTPCTNCMWPLHTHCQNKLIHISNECKIFSGKGIDAKSCEKDPLIYDKLMVLRGCLLKLQDSKKWGQLLELESHKEGRSGVPEFCSLSKAMVSFVRDRCELAKHFSVEDVDHVVGVVIVNAYVTEDNLTSSPKFKVGSFVFYHGSMPAHSCVPNCKWVIQSDHKLALIAVVSIKEDACLAHCYSWGGVGTFERQRHLIQTKFFSCRCERCIDPSELGTNFSAVKCKLNGCSDGFLLPEISLHSTWKCSGSDCTAVIDESKVLKLVADMRKSHGDVPSDNTVLAVQLLENLRSDFLKHVGENHYVIAEVDQDILVRLSLVLAEGEHDESLDKISLANKMINLSSKCLKLMSVIAPGSTSHAGRQMYYLQMGMGVIILDQIRQGINTPELRQKVEDWQGIRRQGFEILQMESEGREEYVLGQTMLDQKK